MAQKEILILDASVAVKWFNPEPLRKNALAIRENFRAGEIFLVAPALINYEVANALRYNPKFGIDEVKLALKAMEDLQLEIYQFSSQLADETVQAAFQFGITAYDATYVALALIRRGILYTADGDLVAKVSNDAVKHLSEFPPE